MLLVGPSSDHVFFKTGVPATPRVGGEKASVTHLEGDTLETNHHFGPFWVSMLNFEGVLRLIILTNITLGQFMSTAWGANNIPLPVCMFKDDFPFPQVGYVSCLEGMATSYKSWPLTSSSLVGRFPFHLAQGRSLPETAPRRRPSRWCVASLVFMISIINKCKSWIWLTVNDNHHSAWLQKVIASNNMFRRSSPPLIKTWVW